MTQEERQVRKFYEAIWNQHDRNVIPEVLHDNITFRGSLGSIHHGLSEFTAYLDGVHESLADYNCVIDDLVCEANRVFARVTFTGIHEGELLGFSPTGRRVSWVGDALFTFEGDRVSDLWVLGDLSSLERQLEGTQS